MHPRTWALAGIFAFAAVPLNAQGEEAIEAKPADAIVVQVSNLQSDEGQIGCAIFSNEDGFPSKSEKADKQIFVKSKAKKATCTFEGVKPGTYAVSVMHDADKNGELNTSFVGKPKEWWGVSNNAPAQRFGPPKYEAAKFRHEGGVKTLKVKLQL